MGNQFPKTAAGIALAAGWTEPSDARAGAAHMVAWSLAQDHCMAWPLPFQLTSGSWDTVAAPLWHSIGNLAVAPWGCCHHDAQSCNHGPHSPKHHLTTPLQRG